MDSPDAPQPKKKSRLIYDRETLLEVKKNAPPLGIYDSLTRVSAAASVSLRAARGKTRASAISKGQNGCSRDSSNIVLGPQKRTWNTGCHVSHPSGREPLELYGSGSRGGKSGSDYRFSERHTRGSNDYKRDFRGGHSASRDRGLSRRADGLTFCRMQGKDDRHPRENRGFIQEEPEWFSEGPTTVNETIELGRILEEIDDDAMGPTPVDRSSQPSDEVACVGDAKVSSEDGDGDLDKKGDLVSNSTVGNKNDFQIPVTTISQLNLFDALQIPKTNTSQGSRFKHLFVKAEPEPSAPPKSNINDQLLQLLKGTSNTGGSLHDKNNVIQVENKLRSILLGHNGPRSDENRSVGSESKSTKPQVLTVEEIEAQLSSPQSSALETRPTAPGRLPVAVAEKNEDILKQFSSRSGVGSNLAPMLQSIALKQQQQAACAQSVQLRSTLNTIGMLSNPMVRLPTSTNAVSASARINQLQQTDLSTTSALNDLNSGQPTLRHTWDNGLSSGNHMPAQSLPSSTSQFCLPSQRPLGPPPGLFLDLGPNSTFGSGNPATPGTTTAPRRPIVKMQQTLGNPAYSTLSPVIPPNTMSSQGMSAPNISDVDRRLLNLTLKQQQTNINGPRAINDRYQMSQVTHSSLPGEIRYPPPGLSQNTGSPLVHPVANTNNSAFIASHARSTFQNDSALAFLSQLVDRDRTVCPRPPNFGSFLNSGIKAKTLEEIEHQEVTSSGSFL